MSHRTSNSNLHACKLCGRVTAAGLVACAIVAVIGCGKPAEEAPPRASNVRSAKPLPTHKPIERSGTTPQVEATPLPSLRDAYSNDNNSDVDNHAANENVAPSVTVKSGEAQSEEADFEEPERKTLGDLLPAVETPKPVRINDEQAAAAGIRKIEGKYLTLYTDLPASEEVDALPRVFDLAVPQWADYCHVERERLEDWRLIGFLMQEADRFRGAGLLPANLPRFTTGYSRGDRIWLYEQPSAYYRRHLMLHEGVHGFMLSLLGGAGPPWYMEGIAERLATHRWFEGQLQTSYLPRSRSETPMWGRVKIVKDEFAAGRALRLERIMNYGPQAHLQVEPYGWCWAAALFLDEHPLSQQAFRQMLGDVHLLNAEFGNRLRDKLSDAWPRLTEDWQVLVANFDYGYDVRRTAVRHKEAIPIPADGAECEIAADHGWQSSGVLLEAGKTYRITAKGRYVIARDDVSGLWKCEPGGVTIRYHNGRPLGVLLASLRPPRDLAAEEISALLNDAVVGLREDVQPARAGVLYFRVNEAASDLHDNQGQIHIKIEAIEE